MHAVEGSCQQEEDSSNEVEVVDKPQLHCKGIQLSPSVAPSRACLAPQYRLNPECVDCAKRKCPDVHRCGNQRHSTRLRAKPYFQLQHFSNNNYGDMYVSIHEAGEIGNSCKQWGPEECWGSR